MKVLSLFDGISCGMVALERAGIKVDEYHAFEIDENAIKVSKKNYPNIIHHGDVIGVDFSQFKDFDLVIGGSPCQGFSIAGKKLNFKDERSKLFFEYLRAIKEIQPKYFLFENVYMKKEISDIISKYIGVQPILINSNKFSAQDRKRLYWTNIHFDSLDNLIYSSNIEDIVEDDGKIPSDVILDIFRNLYDNYKINLNLPATSIMFSNIYGGFKEKKPRVHINKSFTIRAGQGGGHIPSIAIYKPNIDYYNSNYRNFIRQLTPLECERLQTLPDNYTNIEGLCNSNRYKCIGNGWTVDVITYILKGMKI